ncbi:hypothetical protein HaLaN_05741 [Haematococcus lacustris]|uniref:Uncharacterized protein n=1 Tax=Haematococcus lacustris TaxID=44745 RepID=A0A699YLP4_HAELA|nr:hypothetical protein HaLaN_05741 [Haematococcus lacustris]
MGGQDRTQRAGAHKAGCRRRQQDAASLGWEGCRMKEGLMRFKNKKAWLASLLKHAASFTEHARGSGALHVTFSTPEVPET